MKLNILFNMYVSNYAHEQSRLYEQKKTLSQLVLELKI